MQNITPFGGVMYRPLPAETCVELTNYLNTLKVPALIAADLEHGGNIIEPNGTLFGAQLAAAATQDTGMAEKLASVCAEEGRAVGINWAFAPDADLDLNWRNPITNCRTNMAEDVSFMKEGVRSGLITQERLNDAVTRILAMKAALGLDQPQKTYTLEEEEKGVLPFTPERYPRIMYFPLKAFYNEPAPGKEDACDTFLKMLEKEGFEVTVFNDNKALEGRLAPTTDFVGKYDAMIYAANYPIKSGETVVRIEWTNPLGSNCPHFLTTIPNIFVSFGNPYHLVDVPRLRTYINAYANNPEVLNAVIDKLTGRASLTGVSPVDSFCGKWDTRL